MIGITVKSRIGIRSYARWLAVTKPSSIIVSRPSLHTSALLNSIFKNKPSISPVTTTTPSTPTASDEAYNTHPILKRVPKFLRHYTTQFIHAPVSHVVSFLVLHELTAIVPLLSLWYMLYNYPDHFQFVDWTVGSMNEVYVKGVEVINKSLDKYQFGNIDGIENKVKLLSTGATSYVIVKFLAPLRVVISLTFMNWFAKWFVIPITNLFKRRKAKVSSSPVTKDRSNTISEPIQVKKVDKPRL